MVELPTGTVTFLFTDLEGSTRLWEDHQDAMKEALARHDAILRESIEGHGGVVFSKMGDGIAAAFSSAPDAVKAVIDAQQRLGSEAWGETGRCVCAWGCTPMRGGCARRGVLRTGR